MSKEISQKKMYVVRKKSNPELKTTTTLSSNSKLLNFLGMDKFEAVKKDKSRAKSCPRSPRYFDERSDEYGKRRDSDRYGSRTGHLNHSSRDRKYLEPEIQTSGQASPRIRNPIYSMPSPHQPYVASPRPPMDPRFVGDQEDEELEYDPHSGLPTVNNRIQPSYHQPPPPATHPGGTIHQGIVHSVRDPRAHASLEDQYVQSQHRAALASPINPQSVYNSHARASPIDHYAQQQHLQPHPSPMHPRGHVQQENAQSVYNPDAQAPVTNQHPQMRYAGAVPPPTFPENGHERRHSYDPLVSDNEYSTTGDADAVYDFPEHPMNQQRRSSHSAPPRRPSHGDDASRARVIHQATHGTTYLDHPTDRGRTASRHHLSPSHYASSSRNRPNHDFGHHHAPVIVSPVRRPSRHEHARDSTYFSDESSNCSPRSRSRTRQRRNNSTHYYHDQGQGHIPLELGSARRQSEDQGYYSDDAYIDVQRPRTRDRKIPNQ